MKRRYLIPFCLCLANCATGRKDHSTHPAAESISEKAARAEKHPRIHGVRHPEFVKSYYLGRRPSDDGETMHEAHRVYTIGQSSTWNLLGSEPSVNGPVVAAGDSAKRPSFSSRELEAEKRHQEELSEQLIEAQHALTEMQAEAERRLPELQQYLLDVIRRGASSNSKSSRQDQKASKMGENPFEALRDWGARHDVEQ